MISVEIRKKPRPPTPLGMLIVRASFCNSMGFSDKVIAINHQNIKCLILINSTPLQRNSSTSLLEFYSGHGLLLVAVSTRSQTRCFWFLYSEWVSTSRGLSAAGIILNPSWGDSYHANIIRVTLGEVMINITQSLIPSNRRMKPQKHRLKRSRFPLSELLAVRIPRPVLLEIPVHWKCGPSHQASTATTTGNIESKNRVSFHGV